MLIGNLIRFKLTMRTYLQAGLHRREFLGGVKLWAAHPNGLGLELNKKKKQSRAQHSPLCFLAVDDSVSSRLTLLLSSPLHHDGLHLSSVRENNPFHTLLP